MRRRQFVRAAATVGVALMAAPGLVRAQSGLATGLQASVTTDGLNLRGGPGGDEPVVGNLAIGSMVDLLAPSSDGTWWRAVTDAGIGYLSADYLEPSVRPSTS